PTLLYFSLTAPPTPETSPLSLHDALPIWTAAGSNTGRNCFARNGPLPLQHPEPSCWCRPQRVTIQAAVGNSRLVQIRERRARPADRKSTRLNSSHVKISYAVFCLKKKKNQ